MITVDFVIIATGALVPITAASLFYVSDRRSARMSSSESPNIPEQSRENVEVRTEQRTLQR